MDIMDRANAQNYFIVPFILIVFVVGFIWVHNSMQMERLAKTAAVNDYQIGYCFENDDIWFEDSKTCVVTRAVSDDGTHIFYEVQNDRYKQGKLDLNKSKIVGKWLGKKGKQVGKGILEGWKLPDKFHKDK